MQNAAFSYYRLLLWQRLPLVALFLLTPVSWGPTETSLVHPGSSLDCIE